MSSNYPGKYKWFLCGRNTLERAVNAVQLWLESPTGIESAEPHKEMIHAMKACRAEADPKPTRTREQIDKEIGELVRRGRYTISTSAFEMAPVDCKKLNELCSEPIAPAAFPNVLCPVTHSGCFRECIIGCECKLVVKQKGAEGPCRDCGQTDGHMSWCTKSFGQQQR